MIDPNKLTSTYVCLNCNKYWNIAGCVEFSKGPLDHSRSLRHEVLCLDKFLARPMLPTYLELTEDEKARLAKVADSYDQEAKHIRLKIEGGFLTSNDALNLRSDYDQLKSVIKSILNAHGTKKRFGYRY